MKARDVSRSNGLKLGLVATLLIGATSDLRAEAPSVLVCHEGRGHLQVTVYGLETPANQPPSTSAEILENGTKVWSGQVDCFTEQRSPRGGDLDTECNALDSSGYWFIVQEDDDPGVVTKLHLGHGSNHPTWELTCP